MSNITLSAGIRDNLLSLQGTADLLAQTQKRLSSGKKVNSALDNPTTFFTAQGLNSRANDLASLLDNISNATKTIDAADKGISSITKLLESAKATANQARLDSSPASVAAITSDAIDGATTGSEAAAKQLVADLGLAANNTIRLISVDSTAGTTSQNDFTVTAGETSQDLVDAINASGGAVASITVDGKLKIEANNTNSSLNVTIDTATPGTFTNEPNLLAKLFGSGVDVNRSAASSAGAVAALSVFLDESAGSLGATSTIAGTDTLDDLGFADGDVVTLTVGTNSIDFTIGTAASDTVADLVAGLDAISGAAVSFNAGAHTLDVALDDSASTDSITLSTDGAAASIKTHVGATPTSNGLSDTAALVASYEGGGAGASAARIKLAGQFNELRSQIDKLAQDASFNGVNLLNGDNLEVVFNEKTGSDRNTLNVQGVTYTSSSLGVKDATDAVTGYANFASNSDVDNALADLADSVKELQVQSSTFGSNLSIVQARQDFTKNLISTLQQGADSLVLADSNEEAANLLALQTRQSLSQTALSLASQSDQSVLRLFQ